MSDIRFVGDDVHVEGSVQKVTCFDVELDNAGRRRNNRGRRRALVHDFTDGLTLNWDRDYPGAVTINGDTKLPDGASVEALRGTQLRCSHHTLHLDHRAHRTGGIVTPVRPSKRVKQRRALQHNSTDGLTINVERDYPGGVTIRGAVRLPESLSVGGQDPMALIATLQAQLAAMQATVATLQADLIAQQAQLAQVDGRVTALENAP